MAIAIRFSQSLTVNHDHLRIVAGFMLVPLLTLAASVVAFRLSPEIEERYYKSSVSRLFLGDTGHALYTAAGANNALELERAAGFLYVNVNRASMVLGVSFLVILAAGIITGSRKRASAHTCWQRRCWRQGPRRASRCCSGSALP